MSKKFISEKNIYLFFGLCVVLFFTGCGLFHKDISTDDAGFGLSGRWIGVWKFSTVNGEITCSDLKTIIITRAGNTFTGSGSFVAQPPINEDCETDGEFTVTSVSIDGNEISMIWDFEDNVIAKATGIINKEKTIMKLQVTETINDVVDGKGPITLIKQ